ncbi:MAG: hypothetical protein ACOC6H_02425 [Thermoproteota archaeon]
MSRKVTKSLLPFVTLPQDLEASFDKDLERAAIFCLAEQERDKGGGLLLKHPQEQMEFIAQVCYPFWWVNVQDLGFIFDGLLTTSQTLTYSKFPDIPSFIEQLEGCKTGEDYLRFLSEHVNYFQVLGVEEEKEIEGLIRDRVFLDEFAQYLREAEADQFSSSDKVLISPKLDADSLNCLAEEIGNIPLHFKREVELLCHAMKLVKTKTQEFLEVISDEMERVKKTFDEKEEQILALISEKTEHIREEYDRQMAEYSQKTEEDLMELQKAKIKLEKKQEKLAEEIEQCESEVKSCAIEQDKIGKNGWKKRENRLKKEISEDAKNLEDLTKKIEVVQKERKTRLFDLKTERDNKIKEVDEELMDFESSRDAQISIYREKKERLGKLAPNIIDKMDELAKLREKAIKEFGKLGIEEGPEDRELVYMPFYLVCYKSESGQRYTYFPSSLVKDVSFSVKFKGALGKARINQLFQPRTETIDAFLDEFLLLMRDNPVFNREVNEACGRVNLLQGGSYPESIESGLKKLKDEGWLTEKEYTTFYSIIGTDNG